MAKAPHFRCGPLTEMVAVGAVDASSVRLWVRTDRPGDVRITCCPEGRGHPAIETHLTIPEEASRDNTAVIRLPERPDAPGLMPLTRYRFQIHAAADGHLIGEGRFETAPESPRTTPARFSFALMSCNQPFNDNGSLNQGAVKMLQAARRCLTAHDVKYILMLGDQMYTDYPQPLSLFNRQYFRSVGPRGKACIQECSAEQVRRLFQERYRHFWNVAEWQDLHAGYPTYPILDDHDMIDNWGSDPAHQKPPWRSFGRGATMAYYDYQASRVLASDSALRPSYHYAFAYGPTATFVMDLRTQRTAGESGRLYGPDQRRDLEEFLHNHAEKQVVFLVLSVPAIHLPKFITRVAARMTHSGEDFSDRWSSGGHVRDRDRLFKLIYRHQQAHPRQKIVLLSGDIHIGCAQKIQWHGRTPPFYQLISSGITHSLGRTMQLAAKLLMTLNRSFSTRDGSLTGRIDFLRGDRRIFQNPYGGMNLGIVEVQSRSDPDRSTLRFFLYGHHGRRPMCVYRSSIF